MRVAEWGGRQAVMEPLSQYIVQSSHSMVYPGDLKAESSPFSKTSLSMVFSIEVPRVCISAAPCQVNWTVRLGKDMMMSRHKTLAQKAGFRMQHTKRKAVKPHVEVCLASEHYFFVGGKT